MKYTHGWQLVQRMKTSISNGSGFAAISIGDGEAQFLSHPDIRHSPLIARHMTPAWRGIQDRTRELLPTADYAFVGEAPEDVGPAQRKADYWFHNFPEILQRYRADVPLVASLERYTLVSSSTLFKQIAGARTVLVGHYAQKAADRWIRPSASCHQLLALSAVVPCSASPYQAAISDTDRILADLSQLEFDVALVSTGINANLICLELKRRKKAGYDFGCCMNWLAGVPPVRVGLP
jgi:hypothetical protein